MRLTSPLLFAVLCVLSTPAKSDVKVAYVDLKRALADVGEGQAAKARLKGEMDKRKTEFETDQTRLRDDKAVLDKQGAMMSEEVRMQKFTELQNRLFELTQRAQKMQLELAEKERQELQKIFDKMDVIIASIAARDELSFVFEKTDSGLLYAPPALDRTQELIRTYNEKHPSKGASLKTPKTAAVSGSAPSREK
jgi:outer membrane protein